MFLNIYESNKENQNQQQFFHRHSSLIVNNICPKNNHAVLTPNTHTYNRGEAVRIQISLVLQLKKRKASPSGSTRLDIQSAFSHTSRSVVQWIFGRLSLVRECNVKNGS